MVKGHGDLDETLQKLTLPFGRPAPDILQRLMSFKEMGAVKEPNALVKLMFQRVMETLDRAVRRLIHGRVKREQSTKPVEIPARHLGMPGRAVFLTWRCEQQYAKHIP